MDKLCIDCALSRPRYTDHDGTILALECMRMEQAVGVPVRSRCEDERHAWWPTDACRKSGRYWVEKAAAPGGEK